MDDNFVIYFQNDDINSISNKHQWKQIGYEPHDKETCDNTYMYVYAKKDADPRF